jgi:hypothetical protein
MIRLYFIMLELPILSLRNNAYLTFLYHLWSLLGVCGAKGHGAVTNHFSQVIYVREI